MSLIKNFRFANLRQINPVCHSIIAKGELRDCGLFPYIRKKDPDSEFLGVELATPAGSVLMIRQVDEWLVGGNFPASIFLELTGLQKADGPVAPERPFGSPAVDYIHIKMPAELARFAEWLHQPHEVDDLAKKKYPETPDCW